MYSFQKRWVEVCLKNNSVGSCNEYQEIKDYACLDLQKNLQYSSTTNETPGKCSGGYNIHTYVRVHISISGHICCTAVKPLEYEDEYRALEQNLNLTM